MLFDAARFQRIAFVMLPLLGSTPCFSQDGIVVYSGWAGSTCAAFVADLQGVPIGQCLKSPRSDDYSVSCMYFQYAFGYISRYNVDAFKRGSKQVYDISTPALDIYLRNYCNAHPSQGFPFALDNFIAETVSPASGSSVK
jgi:hypothetical protein